ncbi:hypothetical protein Cgig2_001636 [Carnegiea gigantea]|uniref:Uncharacterized protein n=1 Tax=Carnegiea gigantea TaxID=171969 RepID=A0A9Q1GWF0_9CARY|nr:hypothetical protein Cgig2_001636 [Carnegiea gigantea]
MVVNDDVELFVVSRDVAGDLKSTLKGLRWTTFESWLSVNKHALLEAQLCQQVLLRGGLRPTYGRQESSALTTLVERERESEENLISDFAPWYFPTSLIPSRQLITLGQPSLEHVCPPQLLPKDYRDQCPYFDHDVAKASARDCHIPELTQVVFYAMVLNNVVALGVSCMFVADTLRWVLECLNWGHRRVKIKITARLRSPDELLAERTSEGCAEEEEPSSGRASLGSCGQGDDLFRGSRVFGRPRRTEHALPQPQGRGFPKKASAGGVVLPTCGIQVYASGGGCHCKQATPQMHSDVSGGLFLRRVVPTPRRDSRHPE